MDHLSMWSVLILRESGWMQMASQQQTESSGILGHGSQTCVQLQRSLEFTILPCNYISSRTLPCRSRADPGCFPRTAKSRRWSLRRCRARSFRCLLPHLAANEWLMSHKVGQKQRRRGLFCFALLCKQPKTAGWPGRGIQSAPPLKLTSTQSDILHFPLRSSCKQ